MTVFVDIITYRITNAFSDFKRPPRGGSPDILFHPTPYHSFYHGRGLQLTKKKRYHIAC